MPLSPERKAELNRQLKALLNEPTEQSHDTKTTRERKQEFEKRFGHRTPTSDLVARIEAAERIVWLPHSYVFFVRQATCRNCRTTVRCLDDANLFLQQRKERRDDSNAYLYTPVKGIEFVGLPRRKIIKFVSVPICEACYEGSSCPILSSSAQDATASHTENSLEDLSEKTETSTQDESLSGPGPINLQPSRISISNDITLVAESTGSPSETEFGSVCGEREFATTATAED